MQNHPVEKSDPPIPAEPMGLGYIAACVVLIFSLGIMTVRWLGNI
jgi:hypothetical protein